MHLVPFFAIQCFCLCGYVLWLYVDRIKSRKNVMRPPCERSNERKDDEALNDSDINLLICI